MADRLQLLLQVHFVTVASSIMAVCLLGNTRRIERDDLTNYKQKFVVVGCTLSFVLIKDIYTVACRERDRTKFQDIA